MEKYIAICFFSFIFLSATFTWLSNVRKKRLSNYSGNLDCDRPSTDGFSRLSLSTKGTVRGILNLFAMKGELEKNRNRLARQSKI